MEFSVAVFEFPAREDLHPFERRSVCDVVPSIGDAGLLRGAADTAIEIEFLGNPAIHTPHCAASRSTMTLTLTVERDLHREDGKQQSLSSAAVHTLKVPLDRVQVTAVTR